MINWKLLEAHAKNYDGTCRYCGGRCQNATAEREREKAIAEMDQTHYNLWYEIDGYARKRYQRRLQYLKKRYANTITWRWTT